MLDTKVIKKIVFWQNILSIHQSALISALSAEADIEVVIVVENDITEDRAKLGWNMPEFSNAKIIISPNDSEVKEIIEHNTESSAHIFSGISAYPLVYKAFKLAIKSEAKIGLYSEANRNNGLKYIIKKAMAVVERIRFGRKIDFILAIGDSGTNWFKSAGYDHDVIFQYGYFTDKLSSEVVNLETEELYEITYVGRLIPYKGVDILLEALNILDEKMWKCTIIGDGSEKEKLIELCESFDLTDKIKFKGSLSNKLANKYISNSDVLVLANRECEGWGAVVNEALTAGTKVICTKHTGAHVLISDSSRGTVLNSVNSLELSKEINKMIQGGKQTKDDRDSLMLWSENISGSSASKYLINILNYTYSSGLRPSPPWLD